MKWRDRVQEYVRERGEGFLRNLEQAREECQDRERWRFFCRGHPLVGAPRSRRPNELKIELNCNQKKSDTPGGAKFFGGDRVFKRNIANVFKIKRAYVHPHDV